MAVPDAPTNCTSFFSAPDESYCTWEDNSDDETGFRVEYFKLGDTQAWSWPVTKEMGGVLTLSDLTSSSEWNYCGFSLLIPFASSGVVALLGNSSVHALINSGEDSGEWGEKTVEEWSAISGVEGFWLADDTPYDVSVVEDWYDAINARTAKPIGSIFWKPPHDSDRNKLIDMSNFLDYILVYLYPYYEDSTQEEIDDEIDYMIALAGDLNCYVIIGAQALDTGVGGRVDPEEVGIRHQYEKYYDANLPVWWYTWARPVSDVDIRRNYQDLMREFYLAWTFLENKGANSTQSSNKQFSVGDYVTWRVRAYNAEGASTWSVSDSIYISGEAELKQQPIFI